MTAYAALCHDRVPVPYTAIITVATGLHIRQVPDGLRLRTAQGSHRLRNSHRGPGLITYA